MVKRVFFLGYFFLVACHYFHGSHDDIVYEQKEILEAPEDIRLPSIVWDLLEEKKIINSNGKIVANTEGATRFEENVFSGITVRLREQTPGVLGGKNFTIRAAKSGMSLDLASYIKGDKGTFIISFEPERKLDSASAQVIFLSQSIPRQNDHQHLGGGCDMFYDVTKSYLRDFQTKGVEVNVTDGRHVSFLGGTFFIRISREMGVRAFTQLTITDSSHPELFCAANVGNDEKE